MHKKILIVSNMYPSKLYPSYGVFVQNFCKQLSELGYKFDISSMTKTQNKALKMAKYFIFYLVTFLKTLFGKYDLVYVHYPSFSAAPVNLARRLRHFELITNVHGTDVVPLKAEHEKMLANTKVAVDNSKTVVVPSEYYKHLLIKKYNLDEKKIFVYPSGGINESIFYPYEKEKKDSIKATYNIERNSFVIGYVSRINKAKGWDVFIQALKKAKLLKYRNIKIIIVGSGEDDDRLQEEVSALPKYLNEAIVRFPLLNQRKLADIYNLLDILVFPTISKSESLGLVAIEAMSCGVPVIASDYAAPAFYIKSNINGMKFKVGDDDELARTIDNYIMKPAEEIEVLRRGAIETASNYSSHNIAQRLKEIM